jgi:leucine dehydrogenase
MLYAAGAALVVCDVNENVSRLVKEIAAKAVGPNEIYSTQADIFSPCALGGVINDKTIPQLKVEIIAGAANNQLLEDRHGEMLKEARILYAPDYAANAGGVFNGCRELLGWEPEHTSRKVDEIYDTVLRIFEVAQSEGITTNEAADQLALARLRQAVR